MARGIKTIVQQIRLQGAQRVKAELLAIAATANVALNALNRPIVNNGLTGLQQAFTRLAPAATRFGQDIRAVRSEMLQLRFQMIDAAAVTVGLASAFPIALGGAIAFANGTVNSFNAVKRAASDLGVPVSVFNSLDQLAKKSGQTAKEISEAFNSVKKGIDDASISLQNDSLKGLKEFRTELGDISSNFTVVSDRFGIFVRQVKNGVQSLKGLNLPGSLNPQEEQSFAIQKALNQAYRDGATQQQAFAIAAQAGAQALNSAMQTNQQIVDGLSDRMKALLSLGVPFSSLVATAKNFNNVYSRLAPGEQNSRIAKGGQALGNFDKIAVDVIKRLHGLDNEFQQLSLGTQIFGKTVAEELVKAFKSGANGVDELNTALALFRVNQNISEGVTGGIEKLGIVVRDTNGKLRSAGEVFNEVIRKLAGIADQTELTRRATEIFGDKTESVIKLIETGFRGLSKSAAVAGESIGQLNRRLSEDDPQRPEIAKLWKGEFDELVRSAVELKNTFGFAMAEAFLPTLRRMRLELEDNFVGYQATFENFSNYLKGWTEDIINAFTFVNQNGKTTFINQSQVSEGRKYLNQIAEGFLAFGDLVSNIYENILKPIGSGIATVFGGLAATINTVFGTNLTAISLLTVVALAKITGGIRLVTAAFLLGRTVIAPFIGAFALLTPTIGSVSASVAAFGIILAAIAIRIGSLLITPIGLAAIAIGVAAAVIVTYWDDIKKAFFTGIDKLQEIFGNIATWVGEAATYVKETAVGIGTAMYDGFLVALQAVKDFALGIRDFVGGAVDWVIQKAKSIGSAIGTGLKNLFGIGSANAAEAPAPDGQQGGLGTDAKTEQLSRPYVEAYDRIKKIISEDIPAAFETAKTAISALSGSLAVDLRTRFSESADALGTAFETSLNKIREAVNLFFGSDFGSIIATGVAAATSSFSSMKDSFVSNLDEMIAKANELAEALSNAASKAPSGGSGVTPNQSNGFARGGFVSGPGTGTSDSIPAWLSSGEFVVRAAAVRRYGVNFLSMLNGMRMSPRLRLGVPGFAMGGPVGNIGSAVGDGSGGASGGLTLVLGGESFGGLSGPPDVMGRLQRYASSQQMRSMGRKPSWYGGSQ